MSILRRSLATFAFSSLLALTGCGDGSSTFDPSDPLTRRDPEPAGANCANGGSAIHAGHDSNANGVLDDDEIETTAYVCDGTAANLVRQDVEPPGANCAAGGTAVHTGIDDNANGMLDDAEIDETTYACTASEIWEGDVVLSGLDPAHRALLEQARIVTGSITIDGDDPVHLPRLEVVGGAMSILGRMRVLELPALRTVGSNATVDTPGVDALAFAALERVGGDLFFTGNGVNGESIDTPALREIGGKLTFFWGSKGQVTMPALHDLGGNLRIEGKLTQLALGALESIGGGIALDDLTLTSLQLPGLRTIAGDIVAIADQPLATVDLPSLETLGGQLELLSSPALRSVSLPALRSVKDAIFISGSPAITTLELGGLVQVDGRISISDAPALRTFALPLLEKVLARGQTDRPVAIHLHDLGVDELNLAALSETGGEISVSGSPALRTLRLPRLAKTTDLAIVDNFVLTTIEAPELLEVARLDIVGQTALNRVDFTKLRAINDRADLRDAVLADLSGFPALASAHELAIDNFDRLQDLRGLAALESVDRVVITHCATLRSLDGLDGVTQLSLALTIEQNPALTSLSGLGHLTQVGVFVSIVGNDALADVGLVQLSSIGGDLTIESNQALTSLAGLDALTTLTGQLSIRFVGVPAAEIAAFRQRLGK